MATTTTNYGLSKPALTDYYDITVFNGDMDTIDTALYTIATDLATISETVTTQETTSSELLEAIEANTSAIEELQTTTDDLQTQVTQNASDIASIGASDITLPEYTITTDDDTLESTYSFDTLEDFIEYTLTTLQELGLSVDDDGYVVQEIAE